jgi:hypothetical protein
MAKVNIVMDTSMYDLFRLCECRYNYRYNLNKTLPAKTKSLDRGTVVHLACETYYQCLKDGAKYDYAVQSALMKVKEAGVIQTDLESEEITRIVSVMEEYFDFWRVEDQNFQIVSVEQPFLYVLYEDDDVRIHMAGKIDLIYSDNKYTNMPVDHKSFDRSYEVGRLGNQFKNYCRATGSYFLLVNKIGFQKTLKPHEKYLRVPVSYDPFILDDWRDNVVKVIFHYLECAARNSWPMNETSCDKFNRRCEYYDVCDSSGQEAKLYKLNSNYITVEPWDVSKVLRKSSEVLKDATDQAHPQVEET